MSPAAILNVARAERNPQQACRKGCRFARPPALTLRHVCRPKWLGSGRVPLGECRNEETVTYRTQVSAPPWIELLRCDRQRNPCVVNKWGNATYREAPGKLNTFQSSPRQGLGSDSPRLSITIKREAKLAAGATESYVMALLACCDEVR